MTKILKFKRGNTAKNNAYTGSDGELTVDTSKKTVVVHDGVTPGGSVLATESLVGTKINSTEKAVANGVATLDVNGKVVLTQIPDSVLGKLEYMGTYSFSGGMPTATQKGQYWIASTDGNGYVTDDWAVYNGSTFDKINNTDAVASVAGRTGNVVLTKSDVGLNNVDNTSDANKPVSTATQTALNLKANIANPTFIGTVTATTFSGSLSGNASTATNVAWSGVTSKPTTISGYGITDAQPLDGDLTAIAGLSGTSGILKKTAVDAWVLDTNTYVTSSGVTSVTGAAPIVSSGGNTPSISISAATTSAPGSMSADDKTKLDGIATGANNYVHPTGDGNLHVPATGTTNNGKVLTAGATAGSISWQTIPSGVTDHTLLTNIGTNTHAQIDTALTRLVNTSGTNTGDQTITLTGDVTGSGTGNITTSLSTIDGVSGTYGSSVLVPSITVDSKGRIISVTENAVSGGGGDVGTIVVTGGDFTMSGTTGTNITNATLANSGVTAGEYTKVAVNSKGIVTSGTNPNTIAGFGITDVYTKTEVDIMYGDIASALDTINGEVV